MIIHINTFANLDGRNKVQVIVSEQKISSCIICAWGISREVSIDVARVYVKDNGLEFIDTVSANI